jgi:cation diffusion facilitator CzcD-associated flavoprotein CzcO
VTSSTHEAIDVLIIGAGISGIGAAYHLSQQCPQLRFRILDAQESFGGTWLTHRYPGIRSDTDLYTFGYRFKPWVGPPIATAEEILRYLSEVIDENDLAQHIRYQRSVSCAGWSSASKTWTIEAQGPDGPERYEAGFLWMCQGYYDHAKGYTPDWPGMDAFGGQLVHPQTWPEDLDLTGKRVVVIGSGATAATIVPALAGKCAHVTMLQRSPTYFRTGRNAIEIADELRALKIDESWIHEIVRRKILFESARFARRTFEEPDLVAQELLAEVRRRLGPDFDVAKHFTPRYRPWRQRLAFIPNGDLFESVRRGDASVVTDEIDRFDASGVQLKSGERLDADVFVTATGFNLEAFGKVRMLVDGAPVALSETITLHGVMFTGLPNLAWIFGYLRSGWTLRVDLVADFVCRLLNHMQAQQRRQVTVHLRPEDQEMPLEPWVTEDNFNPGYIARGGHLLPRAGAKPEWRHSHDYWADKDVLPAIDLEAGFFRYQ